MHFSFLLNTHEFIENPMKFVSLQPSVMFAKGKISFAPMIHGCKAVKKQENKLTFKNHDLYNKMAEKSKFHFSFFEVNPQNHKFILEYLSSSPKSVMAQP